MANCRALMHNHSLALQGGRLRVGSLFAGYGGLDLAVEHVFNAKTIWLSEIKESVTHVLLAFRYSENSLVVPGTSTIRAGLDGKPESRW